MVLPLAKRLAFFCPNQQNKSSGQMVFGEIFPSNADSHWLSLSPSISLFHALLGKHCMRTFLWLLSKKIYCNLFSGKPSNQLTENMQEAKKGIPHGWNSSPLCCSSRHPASQPATIVWRVVHLKLMKKSCYPTAKPCNTLAQHIVQNLSLATKTAAACGSWRREKRSRSKILLLTAYYAAIIDMFSAL